MKNLINFLKSQIHHLGCVIGFIIVSIVFFHPVLQGKKILQSDIIQYNAMVKERNDLRENHQSESYWNDSAFVGMPTYQLGANYPYDLIKKLDRTIRFLPRPADYLFLYFIGFYIFLLCLKVDYRISAIGAIAFGFSTYLIIILGVGHNAKAHAIGYFPLVLAGISLVFQNRYLWGGLLFTLALALEIQANHYQMTFYLFILCTIITIFQAIYSFYKHQGKSFLKAIATLSIAILMSIWVNATALLSTAEYTSFSTRGTSSLSINPDGSAKQNKGLSEDYITEYSYGIFESFNLIVPRLLGGSNHEKLNASSKTYSFLTQRGVSDKDAENFVKQLPTYWGNQPIVAAPAYIGIIVFFLFILGIFIINHRFKWAIFTAAMISLLLSWGKNFQPLTSFMIEYFPFYNKFRAVSSIQVILEVCFPVLGFVGLHHFIQTSEKKMNKKLLYAFALTLSVLLILFISYPFLSFSATSDGLFEKFYGKSFVEAIVQDRKQMYLSDLFRSFVLLVISVASIFLYKKGIINKRLFLIFFTILISVDMIGVACRYVNQENFISKKEYKNYFTASPADNFILKDSSRYRVFEPMVGINGARTSYFHHSIGGYHAAKPRYIQDLFDYYISKNNNENILNLLNVKYIIGQSDNGKPMVTTRENVLGNAWFVENILTTENDDQTLKLLGEFNPKTQAIVTGENIGNQTFTVSENAVIQLEKSSPGKLVYKSYNPNDGFAVFSEMYYPKGWQIKIDNSPVKMYRTDYLLRGIYLKKGFHTITFEFIPNVVEYGSLLTLIGNITLCIIIFTALFLSFKKYFFTKN